MQPRIQSGQAFVGKAPCMTMLGTAVRMHHKNHLCWAIIGTISVSRLGIIRSCMKANAVQALKGILRTWVNANGPFVKHKFGLGGSMGRQ